MRKTPLIYELRDEARRHNLKLQGNGRLTKYTIEAHKRLICEAVVRLSRQPPGETEIIESERDDIFVVIRSLETKPPHRCECCPGYELPVSRLLARKCNRLAVAPAPFKPSPPGRT